MLSRSGYGLALVGWVSVLMVGGPGALAHVSLQEPAAAAGSTYRAVLQVPHGCGTEATRSIRVSIPQGMQGVRPMPKPGWRLSTVRGDDGSVKEIVWAGGNLPTDWYDEFVFRGKLAAELQAGAVLHFPVVQECRTARAEWTDTAGAAEASAKGEAAAQPAPRLTVSPAPTEHGTPGHH